MVAIAPFRALRYKGDLAGKTSPPHDTISAKQRDAFLAADPDNIVSVVLPPEHPGDKEHPARPNKFERAAAQLSRLMEEGKMARDFRPSLYLYTISHGPPEDRRTMSGLLCRLRLDPTYTQVRRHERTLQRKKRERLWLREATLCDTEPIWLLYRDQRGWVDEILHSNALTELLRHEDEEGNEHRLWRIDRPPAVEEVVAQFDDRHLVIADGHHRYQTALDHHAATKDPRHGSILACLVRDNEPGLAIHATHRLLHGLGLRLEDAVRRAAKHWDAVPLAVSPIEADALPRFLEGKAGAAGSTDLVVLGQQDGHLAAWQLRLKPGSALAGRGRLDSLAVTLAHERLLRDCWGVDLEKPEEHLRFTREARDVVDAVVAGACELAVVLPPEPVAAVLEVAEQGHVMPQKATYFVPKLRSGLVLSPLDEPLPPTELERAGGGPGPAQWRMPPA
jgi:uncharacterized protein (DUF1015 family)